MYEWSQMLAAVGRPEAEWRAELEAAQALFREAGCPEKDIRNALRNHLKVWVWVWGGGRRGCKDVWKSGTGCTALGGEVAG